MRVPLQRLEPLRRVACAVLKLEHFEVPLRDIFVNRGFEAETWAVEHLGQLDGVFQRELGARSDREMRRMRGVAEEDDVAGRPALALDATEVQPSCRASQ